MQVQTDFQQQWRDGVALVSAAFSGLSDPELRRLRELSANLVETKNAMHALVARVDASGHCAECRGACCVRGKYHFTRADLLAYLALGRELFEPRFDNGLCPYLGEEGCLMPPECRPFTCITFNCERIEDQLAEQERALFYRLERVLAHLYWEIRSLFPGHEMDGALLAGEP